MSTRVACQVALQYHERAECYTIHLRHYEDLRDRLDRNETGWIELDSAFGDGKVFLKLDNIVDLFAGTPGYCAERDEWDAQEKIKGEV